MWFQIEREKDSDGTRFYWSIFQGASTLVAASTRHFDDREQAIAGAVHELRETFGREVTRPLRDIAI